MFFYVKERYFCGLFFILVFKKYCRNRNAFAIFVAISIIHRVVFWKDLFVNVSVLRYYPDYHSRKD